MNYAMLYDKKERLAKSRDSIQPEVLESFERSFNVENARNSTAIEGNTLTLIQTKAILEEGLSVGGKTLREIYEVANHAKAFAFTQKCVAEGRPLDEATAKDIHSWMAMEEPPVC